MTEVCTFGISKKFTEKTEMFQQKLYSGQLAPQGCGGCFNKNDQPRSESDKCTPPPSRLKENSEAKKFAGQMTASKTFGLLRVKSIL